MSKFSIAPPPRGTDGELNIPFVPNIENIIRFANGDLQIADNIRFESIRKIINNSPFMNSEMLNILANTGKFKLKEPPENYIQNNKANVNREDIDLLGDQIGLKALETSLLQSVFETQGPWVKLSLEIIKKLPTLENIISKVLSLKSKSLKPIRNPKSLTYKILGNESVSELESMANNIPDINNSESDRTSGLDLNNKNETIEKTSTDDDNDNYNWKVIDEKWSTGIFLPFVNYNIEYIDIILPENVDENVQKEEFNIPDEPDIGPKTIIFGYFNQNGDEITLPNRYRGEKWFGRWDRITENDQWPEYRDKLYEMIDSNLDRRDLTFPEKTKARKFIREKLDPKEIVEEGLENCFLETIQETDDEEGFNIGNDSTSDINRITRNSGMFLPKTINYNGENITVDPENYLLQIIKIEDKDSNSAVDYNRNLSSESSKNLPLVGNYQGRNCEDILNGNWLSPGGNSRRVQRVKNTDNNDINSGRRYIIEGVLRTNKSESTPTADNDSDSDESKWYRKPSFFSAISDFINMLVDIALELIPQIKEVINLFSDPKNIIFDRIFKTLGENFDPFSDEVLNDWQTLLGIDKEQRSEFIQTSSLRDYVGLDEKNNLKFVFDGIATIPLFGQAFNIELEDLIPKMGMGLSEEDPDPQILIQFMMGIITFPIELIGEILGEILGFFENIADITKLPDTADFFTFSWILDYFKPQGILSLIGIELNPEKLTEWKALIASGNVNIDQFDLSEIISAPILFNFPTFDLKGFKAWLGEDLGRNLPVEVLLQILKLLEGLICGILNFLWDLLNLQALFGNPCFSLTEQIKDLLRSDDNNNDNMDSLSSDEDSDSDIRYNINISDGRFMGNVNESEVLSIIAANPNIKFTFV